MRKPKNILIFRDGLFGDSLLAIPALIELKNQYQDSKLTFLSIESKDFSRFRPEQAIDFTLIIDKFYHIRRIRFLKIINYFQLISVLFREIYRNDIIFILESYKSNKLWIAKFFAVGFKSIIFSKNEIINDEPEWKSLYQLVAKQNKNSYLSEENQVISNVISYLSKDIILEDRSNYRIVLAPYTNMSAKRYSLRSYIEIALFIQSKFEVEFIIAGTKKEISDNDFNLYKENLDNYKILLDQPINKLFEIMLNSDLYIGNDTGPMHLAALSGIELIVIYSAHNIPNRYLPISNKLNILRSEIDCSPCFEKNCPIEQYPPCLKNINKDQVIDLANNIISKDIY